MITTKHCAVCVVFHVMRALISAQSFGVESQKYVEAGGLRGSSVCY